MKIKKIALSFTFGLMLLGCSTNSGSLMTVLDEQNTTAQTTDTKETTEETTNTSAEINLSKPDENAARYRHNVVVKARTDSFITYEYRNIRIDEIAPLAIRHCAEQDNKKAFLRDIVLYPNHNRRATFDCMNLAKKD